MKRKFPLIEGGGSDEQREKDEVLAVLNWIMGAKAEVEGNEVLANKHMAIAQELRRRLTPLERHQLHVIDGKKT